MPVLVIAGALDAKFVALAEQLAAVHPERDAGRHRRTPGTPSTSSDRPTSLAVVKAFLSG